MARDNYAQQKIKIEKEISRLQKQMQGLDAKQRAPKISEIIKVMREFDITPEEIATAYGKRRKAAAPGRTGPKRKMPPVEPRYRHPDSGATWTGRGRAPRWVVDAEAAGQPRDQFLIATAKAKK